MPKTKYSRQEAIELISEETGLSCDEEFLEHLLGRVEEDLEAGQSFYSDHLSEKTVKKILAEAKLIAGETGSRRKKKIPLSRQEDFQESPSTFLKEWSSALLKSLEPLAATWRKEHLGSSKPLSLKESERWIQKQLKKESKLPQYCRFDLLVPAEGSQDYLRLPFRERQTPKGKKVLSASFTNGGRVIGTKVELFSYLSAVGSVCWVPLLSPDGLLYRLKKQAESLKKGLLFGEEAEWVTFILASKMPSPSPTARVQIGTLVGVVTSYRIQITADPWLSAKELAAFYTKIKDTSEVLPEYFKTKRPEAKTLALLDFVESNTALNWQEKFDRWKEKYPKWSYPTLNAFTVTYSKAKKRWRDVLNEKV